MAEEAAQIEERKVTTTDDIRLRVVSDARELITVIGIVSPLLTTISHELTEVPNAKRDATKFLRWHLAKHALLLVTKLHSPSGDGPTGATASIPAVLDYASREARLPFATIEAFRRKRNLIENEMESRGVKLKDIQTFRHAELAHSLHRQNHESDRTLMWHPIFQFGHDSYDLVTELEVSFGRCHDEIDEFEKWMDAGEVFWF